MNQALTYTPTLMEKLLGSWYKWLYFIKYNIVVAQASLYATVVSQIANFTSTFITVYIWTVNSSTPEIITYLVIGSLYRNIIQSFWHERIGSEIILGKVTSLLLAPLSYLQYHYCANFGQRMYRNIGLVATSLALIWIFISSIEFNFGVHLIYLALLLPASFTINYFLNVAVGFLGFFLRDRRDYVSTSNSIFTFLSLINGSFIPLDKLPYNLNSVLSVLPTAWLLHHPMQIYLGKYDTNQTILVFLGGIIWCLVLFFLAKLVFKLGLKRNESVGL